MSEAAKHNYDITYDTVDIKIKKRQAPIISPSDNVPSDIPGGRPVNKSNPEVLTETEGPNGVINSIVRDKIIVSPSKNKVITKDDIQEWAEKQYKITTLLEGDTLAYSGITIKSGGKSIDEIDLSKPMKDYDISFVIADSFGNTTTVIVDYKVADWTPINIDTDGDGEPDINIDTNGDGKADINIDTNGDGEADIYIYTNGDGIADTNIPKTGDESQLTLYAMLIALSAAAIVVFRLKKKYE